MLGDILTLEDPSFGGTVTSGGTVAIAEILDNSVVVQIDGNFLCRLFSTDEADNQIEIEYGKEHVLANLVCKTTQMR